MKRSIALLVIACAGVLAGCGEATGDDAFDDDLATTEHDANHQGPQGPGLHFIHISTHGSPLWSSFYDHFNATGHWVDGGTTRTKSAGRKIYWFNSDGKGFIRAHVFGVTASGGSKWDLTDPDDRDHCFQVNALGLVKYTGDSITGRCTPH